MGESCLFAGQRGDPRGPDRPIGSCVLIRVLDAEFQGRGWLECLLHFVDLSEFVSLKAYREGKIVGRCAEAVQIGEGVHASVTTAILLL